MARSRRKRSRKQSRNTGSTPSGPIRGPYEPRESDAQRHYQIRHWGNDMGAMTEVKVPDIGDFTEVPVIEVLVKPGDRVKPEDSLVTLESDKATLDIPAPVGGTVKELKVQVGDKVSEGTLILLIDGAGDAPAAAATPKMPAVSA